MLEIFNYIEKEKERQQNNIELIASENIVSDNVLKAAGSILTNKYAEGYPSNRYYCGCKWVDEIEKLAIEKVCKLFRCGFANVQPHSGASANLAVYFAMCKPNDKIVGMSLDAGGHLTHGAKPTISGKWFESIQYGLKSDGYLDYDEIENLVVKHLPKVLVVGASAYSRIIDFKRINEILKIGQEARKQKGKTKPMYVMVDIAHIAGLVATGLHPNPFDYIDSKYLIVTSTTHKTLRGPRGAIILSNDEDISEKINKSIFPGCQGGPLEHIIAAKAVAFEEALQPEFKQYQEQVIKNARAMAEQFIKNGFKIVSNGTDNHLLLVDLSPFNLTGKKVAETLDNYNITCNKNTIPNDKNGVKDTSGIRIGTPAVTSRGFKENDCIEVVDIISEICKNIESVKIVESYLDRVRNIIKKYPIY
ncbi:MAG: serine hydroxymethyltransferase [Rickettsiales bacterium]|jgi:glycine hydroxymethyltransferase|nr:serine hydroxymethyltransferase [Rickettsiales bacterium]